MWKTKLTQEADAFAVRAHVQQTRKYTEEPYVEHCREVARLVQAVGGSEAMVAAALLHDTLEDTDVVVDDLKLIFPFPVPELVQQVTDVSKPEDGNRKARKQKDLEHLAMASQDAKVIKLADIISNVKSIISCDTNFARTYIPEKRAQLAVLKDADVVLYMCADKFIAAGEYYLALLGK